MTINIKHLFLDVRFMKQMDFEKCEFRKCNLVLLVCLVLYIDVLSVSM